MNLVFIKSLGYPPTRVLRHNLRSGSKPKGVFKIRMIRRNARNYSFQDFGRFAEPSRLLQATEIRFLSMTAAEAVLDTTNLDDSSSIYILKIRTSNDFGSALSGGDAAIMISLIDVNGDSILQRIPSVSSVLEGLHFQRGSVDVLGFQGPKLSQIEALWVGLESGSWRLNDMRLHVIGRREATCMQYAFEADEGFLGDSGGSAMLELRAQQVKESSLDVITDYFFQEPREIGISAEETMAEYSDLKLSLLLYNSLCVGIGSAAVAAVGNEVEAVYAFLAGGACGFAYLLLLQRSVDGLSSSSQRDGGGEEISLAGGKLRGSLWQLAVILAAAGVVMRVWVGGGSDLAPGRLFLGLAGFLCYKFAVVLAAFVPLGSLIRNQREP
ncbi:lipase/lipooxygenase, PLAT/LH2 family protein [Wolffia australiana]